MTTLQYSAAMLALLCIAVVVGILKARQNRLARRDMVKRPRTWRGV